MGLVIIFILGVANFALHKAVLESRHPILVQAPWMRIGGGRFGLGLEFIMLLGALLLVYEGSTAWAWGYAAYSVLQALSAWLILSGRI